MKLKTRSVCRQILSLLPMLVLIFGLVSVTSCHNNNPEAMLTLEPLAQISATQGSVRAVTAGGALFADGEHVFADVLPSWLDGQSYLCTDTAGGSVTVEQDGWLYMLTPAAGEDSRTSALQSLGFASVATVAGTDISSALGTELTLLGKQASVGEVISWNTWGLLIAAEIPFKLRELAGVSAEAGTVKQAVPNGQLFADRQDKYLLTNELPTWLNGTSLLVTDYIGSHRLVVNQDGWLYFLTVADAHRASSQLSPLKRTGFEEIMTLPGQVVSPTLTDELVLLGKQVTCGEEVKWNSWAIPIASAGTHLPHDSTLATVKPVSGASATVSGGNPIFSDRAHCFTSPLPDWLEGMSYLKTTLEGGMSELSVTEGGWVYLITPAEGSNSQRKALEFAGYSCIQTLDAGVLSSTITEPLCVMGKQVKKGDTLKFGQWGILLCHTVGVSPVPSIVKQNPSADEYQDGNRNWQGIPGIVKASNGRLWACWYSGGESEGQYNWSLLYTSTDDGKSWTGPVLVLDPDGALRAFDCNIWMDPDGRMWFFWSQDDGLNGFACNTWAMYTDDPESAQPKWSQPKLWAGGIAINDPIVLTRDSGDLKAGTWVLPTAVWANQYKEPLGTQNYSNCFISTDKGMSWTYRGSVTEYTGKRDCDENMIIQDEDGNLRMYIRLMGTGIEQSVSTDGGLTWSKSVNAELTRTCSRFHVRRLASGNLLMIRANPAANDTTRTYLTAFLSEDDGKTWPYSLLLDRRVEVSYPDAYEDADGNIYIAYDCNRWTSMEILMAKITEEDIKAGKLVTEGSVLGQLINNNGGAHAVQQDFDYLVGPELSINEDMATYTANVGSIKTLEAGGLMFSDSNFTFRSTAPQALVGRNYLCAPKDGTKTELTVTRDGWLYVLVNVNGGNPQVRVMREQGFVTEVTLSRNLLTSSEGYTVAFMSKYAKAGEVITLVDWSVALAPGGEPASDTTSLHHALRGKTIAFMGDSITTYEGYSDNARDYNSTIAGNRVYYRPGHAGAPSVDDTYWKQLIDKYDMTLTCNNSISASRVKGINLDEQEAKTQGYTIRPTNLHDDTGEVVNPDIICIYMGMNDRLYYDASTNNLGSFDAVDLRTLIKQSGDAYTYAEPSSFAEAYCIMLHKVRTAYPDAEILVLNLPLRSASADEVTVTINGIIKDCADHFGAHLVDLYGSRLSGAVYKSYSVDNIHPNVAGMDVMTQLIETMLRRIYLK